MGGAGVCLQLGVRQEAPAGWRWRGGGGGGGLGDGVEVGGAGQPSLALESGRFWGLLEPQRSSNASLSFLLQDNEDPEIRGDLPSRQDQSPNWILGCWLGYFLSSLALGLAGGTWPQAFGHLAFSGWDSSISGAQGLKPSPRKCLREPPELGWPDGGGLRGPRLSPCFSSVYTVGCAVPSHTGSGSLTWKIMLTTLPPAPLPCPVFISPTRWQDLVQEDSSSR